jgi:capsular polysaccharide transport system permease protein
MANGSSGFGTPTIIELLRAQRQVLFALMLRDIRTRFFGKAWGFVIAVAWPLSHILLLLLINLALGRIAPYGESTALWFATSIVPFMSFSYMSRFIQLGIVLNKPLMTFPVLKVTDVLFARAIVEVLNSGVVVLVLMLIFWCGGVDFVPSDPVEACYAMLAAMLLGVGFGVVSAVITAMTMMWVATYGLLVVLLWMISGILFVPASLPAIAQYWLSFLPTLQVVEWMRSAYYDGYAAPLLDKEYALAWGVGSLFVGLVMERFLRGRLLY